MDEARDALRARRLGNRARPESLHCVEGLATAFRQDADEIDDGVRALDGAINGPSITQVRLDRLDLTDHAKRLQMPREVGTADGDADPMPAPCQRLYDVAADKAGAAEYGHELGGGFRRFHQMLPQPCGFLNFADFLEPTFRPV